MTTHNPKNERIKRQYFAYLKAAKGHSEATVDAVAKALARFETDTKYRDFKAFHFEQAIAFQKHLADQDSQATGEKLSKATLHATLSHLKRFFQWLAWQPGFKSRLTYSHADYFNLSDKDTRVATAHRQQRGPTLEQVKQVIATMPGSSEIERRDRALVAFALLTGARDSAIATIKLKHVNLEDASVFQDARQVDTKFSKSFTTYFFPVGEEVRQIVTEWVKYLRQEKLWSDEDPLFPATLMAVGANYTFEVAGLKREHWSSAAPIRGVFKKAFLTAGLPYSNPHSLRNTLVRLGQTLCLTPESFKSWSQNLAHESVMTTIRNYGEVETRRQGEIIRGMSLLRPRESTADLELAADFIRKVRAGIAS